ncbi:MAG: NAD(P)H-hydrate epimerase [Candidatus Marinimicrobia bacterium]|nr:NAD(P)H-hydrate epimerase [Candidatus Neomarinimicrobiota bacterium]
MSDISPPTITASQMREIDRLMIEEYGISLEQMMENAGRNLADLSMEILNRQPRNVTSKVMVVCGHGNNGGGGMVAARFLSNRGIDVTVILAGSEDKLKSIPSIRWQTLKKLPVKLVVADHDTPMHLFREADLIIDAVIGYSLSGNPYGIPGDIIQKILESQNQNVLSLDMPSGFDTTTGIPYDLCIKAMATMTLALPKEVLMSSNAKKYVGELYLTDIGIPPSLYKKLGLSSSPLFTEETILRLTDC